MKITLKDILFTILFTLSCITLYLVIVYLYFSLEGSIIKVIMNTAFFICQVPFVLFLMVFLINKYMKYKRPLKYLLVGTALILLTTIYMLAYYNIWVFPVISSILIYTGLFLSGIAFLLVKNIAYIRTS